MNAKLQMLKVLHAFLWNASSILLISWLSMLIIGRVYEFHSAYIGFLTQVESEQWLLRQCEEDEFYHNMAYHTDLCATVTSNSKISPTLFALNASARTLKLCGFYECGEFAVLVWSGGFPVLFCLFMVYVCTPSFLLPVMRSEYERRRDAAFVRQCSPALQPHPLDVKRVKMV